MEFKDKIASIFGKNSLVLRISLNSIMFSLRLLSLPVIRNFHPWISYNTNQGAILPINIELQQNDTLLPFPIVTDFIEKSSHRFIMDVCGCRKAYKCKNHTPEIGCLFLGESVLDISPGLGRLVTKKEAHEHAQRAVAQGLVPVTGKVRVDNFIFNTPDRGKLMSLCFCCHCCCMGSFYKNLPTDFLNRISPPIAGLEIVVTDKCTGCGTCLEYCLFEAISIKTGRAVHSDICRGCGRCATYCPEKAINISLNNPNYKKEVVDRMSSYIDVS